MAESRPAGQTKGQEGTAHSTGSGSRDRVSWEKYRDAARLCRDEVRRAKVQLELNLARDAKNNKKGCYRYVNQKRKVKESVPPDAQECQPLINR